MDTVSSAVPMTQTVPAGLANDTLFWLALGGAIFLASLGVSLAVIGLYRLFWHAETIDDLETGKEASPTIVKARYLPPYVVGLLTKIKQTLVRPDSKVNVYHNNQHVAAHCFQTVDPLACISNSPASISSFPPELPEIPTGASFDILPDIIVSLPSSPYLICDDTTRVEDDYSVTSPGSSLSSWDSAHNVKDCDDNPESRHGTDTAMVDILFDELEAYICYGGSLAFVTKERFSDETSHSISDTLSAGGSLSDPCLHELTLEAEVADSQFLEEPPHCLTQPEREASDAITHNSRSIVTSTTVEPSALTSSVQVHWKSPKVTTSLSTFVSRIPVSSLYVPRDIAKDKSSFSKSTIPDTLRV